MNYVIDFYFTTYNYTFDNTIFHAKIVLHDIVRTITVATLTEIYTNPVATKPSFPCR